MGVADARSKHGRLPKTMSDDDSIDPELLLNRLKEPRAEHRDLDDAIEALLDRPTFNHLQIQRMKKRKLRLRDEISRLESRMIPDIIA